MKEGECQQTPTVHTCPRNGCSFGKWSPREPEQGAPDKGMLPVIQAIAFSRELGTGRTRPCVFECVEPDGHHDDFVVKFRSSVNDNEVGLSFECIALSLAHHFGIATFDPRLVVFPDGLAESLAGRDADVADRIRQSPGYNFATRFTAGLFPVLDGSAIPLTYLSDATAVFSFDGLIENCDRGKDKPNLHLAKNRIFVFDHELAFAFVYPTLGPTSDLWRERLDFLRKHVLYDRLKRTEVDFRQVAARLEGLSDERIAEAFDFATPLRNPHNAKIRQHIQSARDDSKGFFNGLREVLS